MKYPIDRKERVLLGGVKQAIHIWGTKAENPVVLFLHGGPGVPNRHGMARNHMDLLDDFTIVAWDQRGTGGSRKNQPLRFLSVLAQRGRSRRAQMYPYAHLPAS